jgi:hypothetical protein
MGVSSITVEVPSDDGRVVLQIFAESQSIMNSAG